MNIDQELYRSNPFYRRLIDQTLENERKRQELQYQIENLHQEMMNYANQIPYHSMTQTSPHTWRASYPAFENNYAQYWQNRYNLQQQYEQQCRANFKTAIDAAAQATENTDPVASIVFDSVGLMTADNLFDAVVKTLSIIRKAQKL